MSVDERAAELGRQVEALKAAIRKVIEGNVQETTGPYSWKNNKCKHGNYGYQGCEWCVGDFLQSALDAVEKPETRVPEFIERGADEQT